MATVLAPFPDAELLMMAMLEQVAPTYTTTPNPMPATPLISVQRVGGPDDWITDFPRVQVQVFGNTREQAWQLAEQCRQIIIASRRTIVNGVLIDNATTVTPAQQPPDPNVNLKRVVAIYQLEYRRPRAS